MTGRYRFAGVSIGRLPRLLLTVAVAALCLGCAAGERAGGVAIRVERRDVPSAPEPTATRPVLAAPTRTTEVARPSPTSEPTLAPTPAPTALAGSGSFTVPLPGSGHVPVWFHAPVIDLTTAPIVIVVHGRQRNAEEYRDTWVDEAEQHGFLVVAPEFGEADYPGSEGFNLGGVHRDGVLRDESAWTFATIEPIFDAVVAEVDGAQTSYGLYGHSAGAQFVHRFVLFTPEHRAAAVVVANAGWYTVPELGTPYPYGLEDAPAVDLVAALRTPLVVMLGAEDTEIDDALRRTAEADAQGPNRLERGRFFHERARDTAAELGVDLAWDLVVVPGVGHDHTLVAPFAALALVPS